LVERRSPKPKVAGSIPVAPASFHQKGLRLAKKTLYPLAHRRKTLCIIVLTPAQARMIMALNPAKFIREVRVEARKVTWPTRKETVVSATLVFVIALIAALFFLLVDTMIAWGVRMILGLGN
jgi:preprotein translocase subunit SecE